MIHPHRSVYASRSLRRRLLVEQLEARYCLAFSYTGIFSGYLTFEGTINDDTMNDIIVTAGFIEFITEGNTVSVEDPTTGDPEPQPPGEHWTSWNPSLWRWWKR